MYESFGPVTIAPSVEFRLFFPDNAKDPTQYTVGGLPRIVEIRVTGDFQSKLGGVDWDLASAPQLTKNDHPSGWLYTFKIDALPDGFYQYKYFVTFEDQTTRWCTDPCTRWVGTANENAAFVIGGNDLQVRPLAQPRPLEDLVIYEVMLDDFTAGYRGTRAPVDAVWDKLDYLVSLGVNTIELMPITAWRGGVFDWGYDPFLYFAVENRYIDDPSGPLDRLYRLKRLIDELHRRGLQVILDGVFADVSAGMDPGTGFPYHWLYQNPSESPYVGRFTTETYNESLNYTNGCTEQFIGDAAKFWLDEYQFDGIRFDYSLGYYIPGDSTQGIPQLVRDLRTHLANAHRDDATLVLEHLTDNRYDAIDATNAICADGCWYDRFLYDLPGYAAAGQIDTKAVRLLDTSRDFAAGKGPVIYVDNHDHSTLVNRVGGRGQWWKTQPPLLALCTSCGAVLLRNGQEFGDDYFVPDDGPDRIQPRPLHWDYLDDPIGQSIFALCQRWIGLRNDYPALRSANFYPQFYDERRAHFDDQGYGVDVDKGVAIYHRWGNAADRALERFIVALNFSPTDQWVDIPFSVNGEWQDLLNGGSVAIGDFWLHNQQVTSNWGRVYYRKESG